MSTLVRHIYSNCMGVLAQKLGERLFHSSMRPFERRLVIVPSPAVKEYLIQFFAKHPDYHIFAGARILPLSDAFLELLELSCMQRRRIPSSVELSLRIEEILWRVLEEERQEKLQPLMDYLSVQDHPKRIGVLAAQLSLLFSRYGLYGGCFLNNWLENPTWQQWIWKQVYPEGGSWTYPIKALEKLNYNGGNIHLFGFSSMPQIYVQLFKRLKSFFYIVSPCSYFWEDVATDRERIGLRRYLEKKNVKEKDLDLWEGFLSDTYPLLANWGKIGRGFTKLLGEDDTASEEEYVEPSEDTILTHIQGNLLRLENIPNPFVADGSIQLHSADSCLREVEILYDQLCGLVKEQCLEPRDILVLAPDLNVYAPFIQMVFGAQDSVFAYSLEGVVNRVAGELFEAVLHLLKIPTLEFSVQSILHLLSFPSFVEKWGVTADEIERIQEWFNQGEFEFDRLLLGSVMQVDEEVACDIESHLLPCNLVDVVNLPLLGKFMELKFSLEEDLQPICYNQKKTIHGWLDYLQPLILRYFHIADGQEALMIELEKLRSHLPRESAVALPSTTWVRVIQTLADTQSVTLSVPNAQKIAFRSLTSGNITESKVIWLLGMDEGDFPRHEVTTSLCSMQDEEFPRKGDEDRYLFLESLLLAKKHLIMSYQRVDPKDNKEQSPSLLIQEFVQHTGISLIPVHHPALPFDKNYFSTQLKSFSQKNYKNACAYHQKKEQPSPFFVQLPSSKLETIDLKALNDLAKDPIRFYFQRALQIFMRGEEDEERDFILSPLSRAILRKKAGKRKESVKEFAAMWKAEGKLPAGVFGDAAIDALEEEILEFKEQLTEFQIEPEEIFSIELSSSCSTPFQQAKNHWIQPSLRIPMKDGSEVHLIGLLENVTPRGFLFHGEDKFQDWVKLWPQLLVLGCLGVCPSRVLLTRCGKMRDGSSLDPISLLQDYLAYYSDALCEPSFLVPTWVSALTFETPLELEKAMVQIGNFENPYLQWLKRRKCLPDSTTIFAKWSTRAKTLYRPMLEAWDRERVDATV